jgi:uncharacterized protein YbaA (DUF1428 family)
MTYFEGFIVPVPAANKDAFRDHANELADLAREFGVARQLEAWEDDVPEGKVTDFRKAVNAKPDEKIVFSFFEYPSKAVRDAANEKFRSDPRLQPFAERTPFDGKRMIMGGFEAITEIGDGPGGYINGFIMPVPVDKREAFREMTARQGPIFREYGALRVVHAWGDDVPEGKVTDFRRSVDAKPDETVVFAFIEWPSKKTSDEAWERLMKDERMQPTGDMPFDGKRMFWGGFDTIVDTAKQSVASQAAAPVNA